MKTPILLTFAVPLALLGSCKFLVQQLIDYTERWPNGLEKSRGKLMGDKQTGEWILSYESGRPLAKGAYKDDRQFGPWTFYYENGNEMRSGSYDERGLRTGLWLYKYEDQTPQSRGSYVDDFEDGPWTFYGPDGAVTMEGQYDAGKQSGLWRYYYAGSRPKAEGLYHRGDRIGMWKVWSPDGASRLQDFGSKPGVQPVRELWPGTEVVRRVGLRVDGQPAGRWASYHQNGRLRFCCGIKDGAPNGVFEARDDSGAVLAQGRFVNGELAPGGLAVVGGVSQTLAPGKLPAVPPQLALWADVASLGAVAPEAMLAALVAETQAEVAGPLFAAVVLREDEQPEPGKPAPEPQEVVEDIDAGPTRMPAPAQPGFTKKQREEMQAYIDEFTNGPKPGGSVFAGYKPTPGGARPKTGTGRRTNLEGDPLPFTKLKGVDGNDVDLTTYRGKQRVMIVVLRGFLGEVCCYCVAQTKALAKARKKLEQANVEVLVIYPGEKENEQAFRRLYEEEFGEGPPPYRVFYDPDLELVTKLGIQGDLASPTTLLIDEQGIVRYAYVGEHRADRPATNALIKLIEGMK